MRCCGLPRVAIWEASRPIRPTSPGKRRSFHRPGSLRRRPRLGPTSPLSPNGDSAHAAATMLTRKNERKNASARTERLTNTAGGTHLRGQESPLRTRRVRAGGPSPPWAQGRPCTRRAGSSVRVRRGGETVTNFEISFPLYFQSFQVPRIGVLRAPMLTSNRRYACTIKIQRPFRLPSLRTHRPTRHPIHHHGRPNSRLPHLRWRADDRPVCVTKSPAIPATPTRKGTYRPTRNTLNSRILRHNSPSPGRLPRFAEAPHLTIPA